MESVKILQNQPHLILNKTFLKTLVSNEDVDRVTLYSYVGVIYLVDRDLITDELFDPHNVNVFCDKIYTNIQRLGGWFDDDDEVISYVKPNLLTLEAILKVAKDTDVLYCANTVKCMLLDLLAKTLRITDDDFIIKRLFDKPPSEFYGYFR